MKIEQPTKVVNLGTKTILKYTPNQDLELNHMVIRGRHPDNPNHFIYETEIAFMLYIVKGNGRIYENNQVYEVKVGDIFYFPAQTKFAAEGDELEYLTFESPAWYPEQASIVDKAGNIIEDTNE